MWIAFFFLLNCMTGHVVISMESDGSRNGLNDKNDKIEDHTDNNNSQWFSFLKNKKAKDMEFSTKEGNIPFLASSRFEVQQFSQL